MSNQPQDPAGVQFPGTWRVTASELEHAGAIMIAPGTLVRSHYQSDPHVIALIVQRGADRSNWTPLTINPVATLDSDEVALKNYGIHEGVYEALVRVGICEAAHRFVGQGYITVPIVRLRVEIPEMAP